MMEGESREHIIPPTVSSSPIGTQLGGGILKESLHAVAANFAEKHGYGYIDFVLDQPARKPTYNAKRKNRKNSFAKVESRSVVRRKAKSPPNRSRTTKCYAKPDVQRHIVLQQNSLFSVENIADQISDIHIPDLNDILASTLSKKERANIAEKIEQPPEEEATPVNEEEIIRSGPLNQYREYLSKVCEDIYKKQEQVNSKQALEKSSSGHNQREAGDRLTKTSVLESNEVYTSPPESYCYQERTASCQLPSGQQRKKNTKRKDNNNNICENTTISPDENVLLIQDKQKGRLETPRLLVKENSPSREPVMELHPRLGVSSTKIRSNLEVVRYGADYTSIDLEEGTELDDLDFDVPHSSAYTDIAQKSPQISSSFSRPVPSRSTRPSQASHGSRQLPCDSKSMKHDYWVCSCPDLTKANAGETKDIGRNKEISTIQRSPTRDSAKKSVTTDNEIAPATSTACAQGDVIKEPSLNVDPRPQEQGDVEMSLKENFDE